MNRPREIVIIGGTACGPKTAARARRCDPQARITIIEQNENLSSATCGFPYYVGGFIKLRTSLDVVNLSNFKSINNIHVMNRTRALAIDRPRQEVRILSMESEKEARIGYDRLVIATGSLPITLSCEGSQLGGIYPLWTMADAVNMRQVVNQRHLKRAVIVGSGLIGLEVAEALASKGLWVTMIEALDWMLPKLLDFETAAYAERHLRKNGLDFLLGTRAIRFEGQDGWVKKVITDSNEMDTDLVILAMGVRPNTKLAAEAGLEIGSFGGIVVDSTLRTNDPHVYAGGDCVENVHRITGKTILAPMGSTANKHGRILGTNVTGGRETFPGVLGTAVVRAFDYNIARVGLTEAQSLAEGYAIETCLFPGLDSAAYYPGARKMMMKLISEKQTGRILGAQAVGPGDVVKRIDVLATAISFGATVDDVANLDLGYAPPYNSAMDPVHHASNVIRNKRTGMAESYTPQDLKMKLDSGDDFILLDVRSKIESENCSIDTGGRTKLISLPELRAKIGEIPKGKEIVIVCQTSIRAYNAQRILKTAGFGKVKFLDGSIAAWPYETIGAKPYDEQSGLPINLDAGI
jgi:NADPH-dependent 2,4-dienoyl-CoA reductase/sulfur reductase-like enzyme/rhodanese-related sulfurtransferase